MKAKPDERAELSAATQARVSALFDAHADRLYRIARRLVSSRDDALDLLQETFLKIARSPKTVPHGAQAEEAWLVRVLVNIRRDQWRKATVRRLHQPRLRESAIAQDDPERTFVVAWLIDGTKDPMIPAWYQIVANVAAIIGVVLLSPHPEVAAENGEPLTAQA
jgi:RNA polymerase sigma factor (sigma-70 family)